MSKPIDADLYDWEQFVVFCEEQAIGLEYIEDYSPFWYCWKRGFEAGAEQ